MTDLIQPVSTVLVGAEGAAEIDDQPWVRPATSEEETAFIQLACKGDQALYRRSLVDQNNRPYFLLTILESAPEEV